MHRLVTSAPASLSQKLSSLRNSEYSSGKSHPQPSWPILESQFLTGRRLSKLAKTPTFMRVHNISCTHELRGLMTTISTLPQRYRSCKSVPIWSELQFIALCFLHRYIGPRSIAGDLSPAGKQCSVLSAQFSVLSSQCSVLSRQCSVVSRQSSVVSAHKKCSAVIRSAQCS